MSMFLHKILKYTLLLSALFGCASLYAGGPKVSFGGYYFSLENNPIFIGAAASDSLVLIFDKESKASFVFNSYEGFASADVSLDEFLGMVYGDKAPTTELTKNLRNEIDKGKVSSKVSHKSNLMIYNLIYRDHEKVIIANKDRMGFWIEIESTNIDTSKLLDKIEVI